MKKFLFMAAALVIGAFSFTSCEKDPEPVVPVISSVEETYTVKQGEELVITANVTNTTANTTYKWVDGNNNVLSTSNVLKLSNKEVGTHLYGFTVANGTLVGETVEKTVKVVVDKVLVTVDFEGDDWSALVDSKQYYGPLLYGDGTYSWTDAATSLSSKLTNAWGDGMFWGGGVAISNYIDADIQNHCTWDYQLSVPESNGSKNFAVVYCDASIYFADGKARAIESIDISSTTYALGVCKYGNASAASLAKSGHFTLIVTAILPDGTEKEAFPYDFVSAGNFHPEWTTVSFSALVNGVNNTTKVKGLKFTMTGSDVSSWGGLNTPTYFAFDNVVVNNYTE